MGQLQQKRDKETRQERNGITGTHEADDSCFLRSSNSKTKSENSPTTVVDVDGERKKHANQERETVFARCLV